MDGYDVGLRYSGVFVVYKELASNIDILTILFTNSIEIWIQFQVWCLFIGAATCFSFFFFFFCIRLKINNLFVRKEARSERINYEKSKCIFQFILFRIECHIYIVLISF